MICNIYKLLKIYKYFEYKYIVVPFDLLYNKETNCSLNYKKTGFYLIWYFFNKNEPVEANND